MLARRFYPRIGGVEKHLLEICRVLARRKYDITIITEDDDPELLRDDFLYFAADKIRIIRLRAAYNKNCLWRELFKLRKLIKEADIIHIHDFAVFIYWYLPLRFLYPLKRLYITFHGWEGVCPPQQKTILIRKITEYSTKGNICAGEFICKWYKTKADFITYGGVHAGEAGKKVLAETGLKKAVFVGRIAADTGIELYLRATRILKEKGINLNLIVCGNGPLMESCKKYVKEHSLDVQFVGWVSDPSEYMANSNYVFVSGFLAILEAFIKRKLVFSVYDNPLKEDYLKLYPGYKNKMMFVAGSPEELAEQLETSMIDKNLINEMTDRAYSYASSQTWNKVADQYEMLWGIQDKS